MFHIQNSTGFLLMGGNASVPKADFVEALGYATQEDAEAAIARLADPDSFCIYESPEPEDSPSDEGDGPLGGDDVAGGEGTDPNADSEVEPAAANVPTETSADAAEAPSDTEPTDDGNGSEPLGAA